VQIKTLQALKEFMYTGKISLAIEDMHEFLQEGKRLQIKGIAEAMTDGRQLRLGILILCPPWQDV
jgi:hypothetical protein